MAVDLPTVVLSILSSRLSATIVGAVIKRKLDRELELQKALLQRNGRVYERQLDTLTRLYRHLWDVHAYAQLMSKQGVVAGENTEEYPAKLASAVASSRDELFGSRLLLPESLAAQCEKVLEETFQWQMLLSSARDPMVQDGYERRALFNRAQEKAFQSIPKLLRDMEVEARRLIHNT